MNTDSPWYRTSEEWEEVERRNALAKNKILMIYVSCGEDKWNQIRVLLLSYPMLRNYDDYGKFLIEVGPGDYSRRTGRRTKTNDIGLSCSIAFRLFYHKGDIPTSSSLSPMAEEYKMLKSSIRKIPPRPTYGPNGTHEKWN